MAAYLGAHSVVLTDRAPYVPLLGANAGVAAASGWACPVSATRLDFGQSLARLPPPARPPFDLVLSCDVWSSVGGEDGFKDMVKTCLDCVRANACVRFLHAGKVRAQWEARCPALLRQAGAVVTEVARFAAWVGPPAKQGPPGEAPTLDTHYVCGESCTADVVVHAWHW
jgi:hypothetical protein